MDPWNWSASPRPTADLEGSSLAASLGAALGPGVMRSGWRPAIPFLVFSAVHLAWQGTLGFLLMIMMGDSGPAAANTALLLWALSLGVHGGGGGLVAVSRGTPAQVPS